MKCTVYNGSRACTTCHNRLNASPGVANAPFAISTARSTQVVRNLAPRVRPPLEEGAREPAECLRSPPQCVAHAVVAEDADSAEARTQRIPIRPRSRARSSAAVSETAPLPAGLAPMRSPGEAVGIVGSAFVPTGDGKSVGGDGSIWEVTAAASLKRSE